MRYITIVLILAAFAVCVSVLPATADTRYVGDELVITLRAGKSSQHKIIKTLKTGTALEVLEEDETYLKVRIQDGSEGYVLRQYVSSDPPKTQRIAELEKLNSNLQKKYKTLETTNSDLEMQLKAYREKSGQEISNLRVKSTELEKNLEQALTGERMMAEKYDALLAQAENVVEIAAERDRLLQQNEKLQAEAATLAEKNEKLADARMIKWFLAGGGVLFLGWLIGRISRKKRSRF
ncbi:MAG: TIGR04211 family SH3 domain-containing protein [Deltaproteobacteria bacterium]|nr:TIGR04211 family SH3 domain-containing protein [Deltaproteobacteria bacterium]